MEEGDGKKIDSRHTLRTTLIGFLNQFAYGAGVLGSAYLLGYIGWSPAWLVFGIAGWVARQNYLREKEIKVAINRASIADEKGVILARLEDLPSWVFFPDIERAEWVNKIMRQLWPFVGHYVKNLLKESVERSIRESLPLYMRSFVFEKIILGDIPPRIGGIKVYQENVARNEIIMDLEVMYSGDCHIQVKVKRMKAGIKDVQVNGKVRVVLKPLVKKMPLIGAVTVFFLNNPAIDFNLTNLADVLDIPGLSDLLRKAIMDQLAALMVLPNKITVPLISDIPSKTLKLPNPDGVLRIEALGAKELVRADVGVLGMGKSDPYAIILVGAQEFRTSVIKNTITPKWNYICEAIVDQLHGQALEIEVMDEDQGSKDDFLGRISIPINSLIARGKDDMWLQLEETKSGLINIRVTWFALSSDPLDLPNQIALNRSTGMKYSLSSALLVVFLDSAKHLPNATRAAGEPSPWVQFTLDRQKVTSSACPKTNDPVWEESFQLLVKNPEVQELEVEVLDSKLSKSLGYLKIRLSQLLKESNMYLEQPFVLSSAGSNAKIFLSLQLKILNCVHDSTKDEKLDSGSVGSKSRQGSPVHKSPQGSPVSKTFSLSSESEKSASVSEKAETTGSVIPSLEEMIHSTVAPIVDTAEISREILNQTSKEESPAPSIDDNKEGRIQLTLRYSIPRNRLIVVVHKVVNLIQREGEEKPDPYVKVYLLPDRTKDNKQKTQVCKNSCNPVYDESLEFEVSATDVSSCSLEITVNSRFGTMFSRGRVLAKATIDLTKFDLSKAITDWYDLEILD
ncbi:extended synaptotagmin-2 [Centruroides vittatus]|uniref:extended synaptotagmin-2 n=1 Tax=Centruroides vittatus TaxID=120091 RepID=UPI0035103AB8